VLCLLALLMSAAVSAKVDPPLRPPPGLDNVRFDQHLGAQLPPNLEFQDAEGAQVRLGDLYGGRPSVLVLGYFGCTNLCGVVRAGLAHAVAGAGLRAGGDFNVIVASINPAESVPEAHTAQTADESALPHGQVPSWRYLTGSSQAVAALAQAAGFDYLFDARDGQYAHGAGIVLLTPQGRVAQYLFGVRFLPQTLRLGLVQASQGAIGTLADRLLLLCCNYDAATGRYSLLIERVLQALGVLTVLALCGLIGVLQYAERRRRLEVAS
jgi:protein SCO1/2